MKLKVKIGELLEAVNKIKMTVDKKGQIVSGKILVLAVKKDDVQAVYLYSTNLVAEAVVKRNVEVDSPGALLLDPDKLNAGLAKRTGDELAEISLVSGAKAGESQRVRVKIGRNQFHLGYDTDTEGHVKRLNQIPFKQAPVCTIGGKNLAEFVRRGMFCIAAKDMKGTAKFAMGGLRLETTDAGYEALVTDGCIAARIVVKGEKGPSQMEGVLIPQQSLQPLSALVRKEDQIDVIRGPKNSNGEIGRMFFKTGESVFGTGLLAGKSAPIRQVIESHKPSHWVSVHRESLRDAVTRATAFGDESRIIFLELADTSLSIRARGNVEDSEDFLDVERISGSPELVVKVAVNADYLGNIAAGSSGDHLKLGFSQRAGDALIVTDESEEISSKYAIMPITLRG